MLTVGLGPVSALTNVGSIRSKNIASEIFLFMSIRRTLWI